MWKCCSALTTKSSWLLMLGYKLSAVPVPIVTCVVYNSSNACAPTFVHPPGSTLLFSFQDADDAQAEH